MISGLSDNTKRLLKIQLFFQISQIIVGVFLNIYLYKALEDVTILVKYNLIVAIMTLIATLVANYLSYKVNLKAPAMIGVIFNIAYYSLLLLLRDDISNVVVLIGILNGIQLGMISFTFNALPYYTNVASEMVKFISIRQIVFSFFGIISPVTAGVIISIFLEDVGYLILFGMSLLLQIIVFYNLLRWNLKISTRKPRKYREVVFKRNAGWQYYNIVNFIMGVRATIIDFLLSVILYDIFRNELSIGTFNTVAAVLGMTTAYILGKRLTIRNMGKYAFFGATIPSLAFIIMLVMWSPLFAAIYLMVNGAIEPLFGIPNVKNMYAIQGSVSDDQEDFLNYVVGREIPIAIGRVVGLFLFLYIFQNYSDSTIYLIVGVFYSSIFIMYLIMFKTKKLRELWEHN